MRRTIASRRSRAVPLPSGAVLSKRSHVPSVRRRRDRLTGPAADRRALAPGMPAAHKSLAVRARAIAQGWPTAAAFAAYLAFSLSVTWPWVTDPTGTVYGVIGGDLTSNIAGLQQYAEERH